MSEGALWDRLRPGLEAAGKAMAPLSGIALDRVENVVVPGMADVNGVCEMKEFWLELKHIGSYPKRGGPVFRKEGLRDSQVPWITKRVKAGGRVFIFAQVENGLVLIHGVHAKEFNAMTLAELGRYARWKHYGPSPDWFELLRAILT